MMRQRFPCSRVFVSLDKRTAAFPGKQTPPTGVCATRSRAADWPLLAGAFKKNKNLKSSKSTKTLIVRRFLFVSEECTVPMSLSKLSNYAAAFTCGDDWPEDLVAALIKWHRSQESAVLNREKHKSGKFHYHSVFSHKNKQTAGVTRQIELLYAAADARWVRGVTVKVKRAIALDGALGYAIKDGTQLVKVGFSDSVLKDAREKWVRRRVGAQIDDQFIISKNEAVTRVLSFIKTRSLTINCKQSFIDVICLMAKEHFQFQNVKMKFLYAQVMAQLGDVGAMRRLLEDELNDL